jgi:N-acetylmuramoyl-L-alanine amidase
VGNVKSDRLIALLLCVLAQPVIAASVAIDVGHYSEEPGVISARGRPEFAFNLDLARAIDTVLKARGHKTRLIGDDGAMKDLWRRALTAQGADLLVSVHHDSARERYLSKWTYDGVERRHSDMFSGFSLFVSRENPGWRKGLRCASMIGAALIDKGFKPSLYHADPVLGEDRPFADKDNGVHYYDHLVVLRHAMLPALLFEAGVIVNREEEIRMSDKSVQKQIAVSVADGIDACLK